MNCIWIDSIVAAQNCPTVGGVSGKLGGASALNSLIYCMEIRKTHAMIIQSGKITVPGTHVRISQIVPFPVWG